MNVSAAPHVRSNVTTASIMRDVAIALAPTLIFGIWNFNRYGHGLDAFILILVCVVFCVATEFVYEKLMKKPITIGDFSAVVTGLILALNLPATLPYWIAALGSIFAILVVKMVYGGLGQNFMNPALAGRCFMVLSFSSAMTSFTIKEGAGWMYGIAVDATSQATPLMQVKSTGAIGGLPNLMDMFLGTTTGTIGEASCLALLIGAAYLLIRRVITWQIPVIYIGTFAVIDLIYQFAVGGAPYPVLYELCGGGLMLGAWFMATDYVTSPITKKGQVIYAILLGLLTALFRFFGESAEGVSFAIIIGNCAVPLIERFSIPKPFGKEHEKKKKEVA